MNFFSLGINAFFITKIEFSSKQVYIPCLYCSDLFGFHPVESNHESDGENSCRSFGIINGGDGGSITDDIVEVNSGSESK